MFTINGRDDIVIKKELKAVMTIEMSFLVPLILFLVMGLILSVFYYHDKNILGGAAYETAVTGSIKMRENEEIGEEELTAFCRERIKGKCIFLVAHKVDVSVSEEEILVEVSARKGRFTVSVLKKAAITEPERKIRNIRRLDVTDGTKNNN